MIFQNVNLNSKERSMLDFQMPEQLETPTYPVKNARIQSNNM